MFVKTILLLLSLFASQAGYALSHLASVYSLDSITEAHDFIESNTLVIMDIDHTIFEADAVYGHGLWFYDQIDEGKKNGYHIHEIFNKMHPHWFESQKTSPVKPIEPETIEFIHSVQQKNIPLIGGTSRQTEIADSTLRQVHSLNLTFEPLPTNQLPENTFLGKTTIKEGVIFCSDYNSKGEVLRAYLEGHLDKFKKIVFIDDSFNNVTSVVTHFKDLPIEVIGLYYPLVANKKKSNWDSAVGRQVYYKAYLSMADVIKPAFYENKEALAQHAELLSKHDDIQGQYSFEFSGRRYVGLPGVYSPTIFTGDEFVQAYLPSQEGNHVLEIGPATGFYATHAALEGAQRVVALDINPLSVKNTELNARQHHVHNKVEARVSNLFEAVPNETFDTIFWDIPQNHTDKQELTLLEQSVFDPNHELLRKFLAQAKSYLTPQGKVYLTYSQKHGNEDFFKAATDFYHWKVQQLATVDAQSFKLSLYELSFQA